MSYMIWPWYRIRQLERELEAERMKFAAIGVALDGNFKGCRKEWQSPELHQILTLRQQVQHTPSQSDG